MRVNSLSSQRRASSCAMGSTPSSSKRNSWLGSRVTVTTLCIRMPFFVVESAVHSARPKWQVYSISDLPRHCADRPWCAITPSPVPCAPVMAADNSPRQRESSQPRQASVMLLPYSSAPGDSLPGENFWPVHQMAFDHQAKHAARSALIWSAMSRATSRCCLCCLLLAWLQSTIRVAGSLAASRSAGRSHAGGIVVGRFAAPQNHVAVLVALWC